MFSSSQIDAGGFASSQSTQNSDSTVSKSRGATSTLPVTVKQISDAYQSSDDKSNFAIDGVSDTNIRLVGLVSNKVQRSTDVTFTLDDCTGRIDFIRWLNDAYDSNEAASIQNGMYVSVTGSLKGFHEKKRGVAFSTRPVVDYNEVTLHFIQCIHMHLENTKSKVGGPAPTLASSVTGTSFSNGSKEHQTPLSYQASGPKETDGSETDIYKLVLNVFQDPASLDNEHGLHVDEVVRRLGIPINKIKEAIDYHVDVGHIYSTIDDYHFKSALID
ncbi:replication protein A 32 kDa subunit A-like [Typha angustifolia]|uniref:replication protein A 32 kDa subunit A-like n=1 Tax=Typha angustifolia TaxID=59011 RepID=UPI003C2C8A4D